MIQFFTHPFTTPHLFWTALDDVAVAILTIAGLLLLACAWYVAASVEVWWSRRRK